MALAFIWLGLGGSASGIVYCLACGFDELIFGMLFLSTLGFVSLCYGVRDLIGHLTVDEAGVRAWPSWFGPSLDWQSIERWRVRPPREGTEDETCLVIFLHGRSVSRRIPASMAHGPGFDRLVTEFRRHAGSREEVKPE